MWMGLLGLRVTWCIVKDPRSHHFGGPDMDFDRESSEYGGVEKLVDHFRGSILLGDGKGPPPGGQM